MRRKGQATWPIFLFRVSKGVTNVAAEGDFRHLFDLQPVHGHHRQPEVTIIIPALHDAKHSPLHKVAVKAYA